VIQLLKLIALLFVDALILIFLAWVIVALAIFILGFLRLTWLFAVNFFQAAREWIARSTRPTKGRP